MYKDTLQKYALIKRDPTNCRPSTGYATPQIAAADVIYRAGAIDHNSSQKSQFMIQYHTLVLVAPIKTRCRCSNDGLIKNYSRV